MTEAQTGFPVSHEAKDGPFGHVVSLRALPKRLVRDRLSSAPKTAAELRDYAREARAERIKHDLFTAATRNSSGSRPAQEQEVKNG